MNSFTSFKYTFLLLVTMLLSACGGDNTGFPSADCGSADNLCVASITISPKFSSVLIGEEKSFHAIATLSDGSEKDISSEVTWSIDNENIATLNTDNNQVVVSGVNAGVVIISVDYRNMQANAQLSVGVITYSISPSVSTILTTMTQNYQAFAVLSNGLQYDITSKVTWTVDDANIASLTVVDGQVTATGVAVGDAKISASYNGTSIIATLKVINEAPDTLLITPLSAVIPAGTTEQYNAFLTTEGGTVIDVTDNVSWAITDAKIASIDRNAIVSALVMGDTTIDAVLVLGTDTLNASATIHVSSGLINKLTISPNNGKFAVGRLGVYRAYAYYSDGNVVDVSRITQWQIEDSSIGRIVESGVFAGDAIALIPGKTTIKASFSGINSQTDVEVTDAIIKSISISPVESTVALGTELNYQAHALYSDGSKRDITELAAWISSDLSVAIIQSKGSDAGIVNTFATGDTTITADFDGISQSTLLSVTSASITEITISPQNPEIPVGFIGGFTATAHFTDKSSQDITRIANWIVDDYTIAAVIPAGDTAGLGKALALGNTFVTVSLQGVSAQTNITVIAATLDSLILSPAVAEIPSGTTQQYQLFGIFSDGSSKDFTEFATFQSSNPSSTSIDEAGLATVHYDSGDDITITATYNGDNAKATIKVTSALLDHLEITPASQSIPIGHKGRLQARAVYSDGKTVDVNNQVTWSVSDGDIASVDNTDAHSGVVLGISTGVVTVTASYQGKTATNTTTVTAATIESLIINPVSSEISVAQSQQYQLIALFSDRSSRNVTTDSAWLSSDSGIASIDFSGLALGQSAGSATITGTYGGLSASAELIINNATVVAIQITPLSPSRPLHSKGQFTAIAFYSDGHTSDITTQATWASSKPFTISIYTGGPLAGGVSADKVGSSDISVSFDGMSSVTTATVNELVLKSLVLSPPETDVPAGATQQYKLFAIYSDDSSEEVTDLGNYQSSDSSSTSIDDSGLATVHYDSGDDITITATYSDKSSTAIIHVTSATVDHLEITPATQEIPIGYKSRLQVRAFYSDGKIVDINRLATWSVDDYNIASVGNDSDDHAGVVLGISAGVVTVTASYKGKIATNTTTVSAATLTSVIINPLNHTIAAEFTQPYELVAIYSDSSNKVVTSDSAWQSSDIGVATIDAKGLATGYSSGTAVIKGTYQGFSAETDLIVKGNDIVTLTSIDITPANISVPNGAIFAFVATATYSDSTTADISSQATWLSDDTSIVSIITTGEQGGLASSLNAGTAIINASFAGIDSATSMITVEDKTIGNIQITPNNAQVTNGTIVEYKVLVVYSDSTFEDVTAQAIFKSLNTKLMTFEDGNMAHTHGVGSVEISASYFGVISEREFIHITP